MWAKNGARALHYLASVFYFKNLLFLHKVLPTMANLKARKIKLNVMLKIIAHPSRFRKKKVHPLEGKKLFETWFYQKRFTPAEFTWDFWLLFSEDCSRRRSRRRFHLGLISTAYSRSAGSFPERRPIIEPELLCLARKKILHADAN